MDPAIGEPPVVPPASPPSEPLVRWSRRDTRFLAICALLAAAGIALALPLFPRAFPEAALDLRVTREESRGLVEAALVARGLDPDEPGLRRTSAFVVDELSKVYLERTLGLDETNRRLAAGLPLWGFEHRWFVPERKEEWRGRVAPDGRITSFEEVLREETPGASLDADAARRLALEALEATSGCPASGWTEVSASTTRRPARLDHELVFERRDTAVGDGALRATIVVAGDRVVSYREFFRVPEAFLDAYGTLRSKNLAAGKVATLAVGVTLLAALAAVLMRLRRREMAGRLAGGLALATFVLVLAESLNGFSLALHGYDTADSFAGFLSAALIESLLGAVFWAGLVLVLALAGEQVAFERLPGQLPLRLLFTRRGLATADVPRGLALGLALAPLFVAYQAVFYLVAERAGAWAPAEVPYTDLLGTSFPWVAVLVGGFLPAVSEELLSRLFSIPWLAGLLRSRWSAVLLSAAIWGFAHAGYPNQPFWIRGAEVGVAGVVIGFVFLRFGLLPCLVWHYTVDAVYTALLLLRSSNPAWVATAAIGAVAPLVPLVIAVVLARRRGGFVDPVSLEAEAARQREAEVVAVGVPRRVEPDEPVFVAVPMRAGVRSLALAGVLGLALLAVGRDDGAVRASVNADGAIRAAGEFLRSRGGDPAAFRSAALRTPESVSAEEVAFLSENGGREIAARWAAERSLWQVRFFRPLEREEWRVGIGADGRITGFFHLLSETAAGARLSREEAEARLLEEFGALGDDPSSWKIVDVVTDEKKNRVDHRFVLERTTPVAGRPEEGAAGTARHRRTGLIAGDRLERRFDELELPEAWLDARSRNTAWTTLRMALQFALAAILIGILAGFLVAAAKGGRIPWREVSATAAVVTLAQRLEVVNWGPRFLVADYRVTEPWGTFVSSSIVGVAGALGVSFAMFILAFGAFEGAAPGGGSLRRLAFRAGDALAACGLGPMLAVVSAGGLMALASALESRFPAWAAPASWPLPGPLDGPLPLASIVSESVVFAVALPAVALAAATLRQKSRLDAPRAFAVAVLAAAVLTPPTAVTLRGWAGSALFALAAICLFWHAALRLLRENPFAWVLAGASAPFLDRGASLAAQQVPEYRAQGVVSLLVGIAILLLPIWFRRRGLTGLGVALPVDPAGVRLGGPEPRAG